MSDLREPVKMTAIPKCSGCNGTETRLLEDYDEAWEPGEVPIRICCDCGEEVEE